MHVDIRERKQREKFIKDLLKEGCMIKEDTEEAIINCVYPISINEDTMEIRCIHNTTCAAAAISSKSKFVSAEEAVSKIKKSK